MEIKKYKFGNVVFKLASAEPLLQDERFEAFRVENKELEDFFYEILPWQMGQEQDIVQKRQGNNIRVYMEEKLLPQITLANLFSGLNTSHLLVEKGAFILHCSYVLKDGKAVLFCAPSGTGKSTQAAFWNEYRGTVTVNEDRAIISMRNGVYYANGCWAMGHSRVCKNVTAPLHKIILLGQGKENCVYALSAAETLRRLLPQCSFDEKDMRQCMAIIDMVSDLIGSVRVLAFDCIKDVSAVEELEKYL